MVLIYIFTVITITIKRVIFSHSLVTQSLERYLLNYMPGTALDTGDKAVNETGKTSCPHGAYLPMGSLHSRLTHVLLQQIFEC